jgi:hypothetical protein
MQQMISAGPEKGTMARVAVLVIGLGRSEYDDACLQ